MSVHNLPFQMKNARFKTGVSGSGNVEKLMLMGDGTALFSYGKTTPTDGGSGYAVGGLFIDTDTTGSSAQLYVNRGSGTSCDFIALLAT